MATRRPRSVAHQVAEGVMANNKANFKYELLRQFGTLGSVGLHLVLSTFAGLAIGYFLDRAFQTKPWLTLLFLGFGIAAGFMNLFRVMRRQGKG
jgi:ATP synthase protein I